MRDFVRWVISRREQSKGTARQRLQVALMRDRFDLAPDVLNSLKQDVLTAVLGTWLWVRKTSKSLRCFAKTRQCSWCPIYGIKSSSDGLPPGNPRRIHSLKFMESDQVRSDDSALCILSRLFGTADDTRHYV